MKLDGLKEKPLVYAPKKSQKRSKQQYLEGLIEVE